MVGEWQPVGAFAIAALGLLWRQHRRRNEGGIFAYLPSLGNEASLPVYVTTAERCGQALERLGMLHAPLLGLDLQVLPSSTPAESHPLSEL